MNQSGLRFLLVFILLFTSITTLAQLPSPQLSPKVVVYGGYSGYNPGGKSSGVEFGRLPHGWNTGAEVQFTPRYSFVADFGGYSRSTVGSTHTYLFGPKFTFHRGPFAPFAQVMMGFQRLAPKTTPTYTAFSESVGGGLDVAIAHRWSVRLFQADFIYAADHEKGSLPLNQFFGARVSAGLVWNFGTPRKTRESAKNKPAPAPAAEPTVSAKTESAPAAADAPKAEPAPAATEAPATSSQPESKTAASETPKAEPAATAIAPAPTVETPAASTRNATEPSATAAAPASQPEAKATELPEPAEPSDTKAPSAQAPANQVATEAAMAPEPQKTQAAPAAQKSAAPSTDETVVAQESKSEPAANPVLAAPAQNVVEEKKSVEARKTVEGNSPNPKVAEPKTIAKANPPAPAAVAPATNAAPVPAAQQIAIVHFPYDQYLTLLSAQDKRTLNAVASRLKLEPESKIVIVGNALRWEGSKTAAQRAVNAKDQLVQKGIAAERIQVLARPLPTSRRKFPPAKTEVVIVPAGATYDAASATPVDEQQVKPEHLHVAHPDWHEK